MYIERGGEETLGPTDGLPRCIFACRAQVPTKWSKSEALLRLIFGLKPAHAPLGACPGPSMCGGAGACIAPRVRSSLVAIRR